MIALVMGIVLGFLLGLIGIVIVAVLGVIFYIVWKNKDDARTFLIFAITGGVIGWLIARLLL